MVTEENLCNGLIINCGGKFTNHEEFLYEIYNLEIGRLYSHYHKKYYDGYNSKLILENLNSGIWTIHNKNNIIELW